MSRNIRIIARLDVKGDYLVKGVQLEGLRKLGSPNDFARKYYQAGIDEIIYMDIVASLYERNSLLPIIRKASDNIFVPLTVGGGLRSLENIRETLKSGADKVAVNTAAIKNPELISKIANEFGSQCVIGSIEAKSISAGKWEIYYDNGREKTGIDAIQWAKKLESLGVGEILLTSVDREGTGKSMDIELINSVTENVAIPVIASGGIGSVGDIVNIIENTAVDAIAIAKILHYNEAEISEIKNQIAAIKEIEVRR